MSDEVKSMSQEKSLIEQVKERYKILSCKYVRPENTNIIDFLIQDKENGTEFPFTYIVDGNDEAPISCYIRSLFNKKAFSFEIHPYEGPSLDSIKADHLRERRNQLLNDTDKYMVIDSILTDEEIKVMRSYRQSLRDITLQKGFPDIELPELPAFLTLTDRGSIEYIKTAK